MTVSVFVGASVIIGVRLDSSGIDLGYPMGGFDLSPLFIGMPRGKGGTLWIAMIG